MSDLIKKPCFSCGELTRRSDGEIFLCRDCSTNGTIDSGEDEPDEQPRDLSSEELVELIRDAGYEPRTYSGRGMYGKVCLGVNLDRTGDLVALAGAPRPTTDSMGLGIVAYWPRIAPPEGFKERE